jgi:hypothetical protein
VTRRLDKVDASVHAVVDELGAIDAVLLLEVGVESGLDVVDNGLPAIRTVRPDDLTVIWTHLSSLLTKSPKPGVSTTVNLSRTPFSSISAETSARSRYAMASESVQMVLSIWTVLPRSCPG